MSFSVAVHPCCCIHGRGVVLVPLIDADGVVSPERLAVDRVTVIRLALVETSVLLGRWVDLHLGLELVLAH